MERRLSFGRVVRAQLAIVLTLTGLLSACLEWKEKTGHQDASIEAGDSGGADDKPAVDGMDAGDSKPMADGGNNGDGDSAPPPADAGSGSPAPDSMTECPAGYRAEGGECVNIDECSIDQGGCAQVCIDEPGTFHCECQPGFRLSADAKTCAPLAWSTPVRLDRLVELAEAPRVAALGEGAIAVWTQ